MKFKELFTSVDGIFTVFEQSFPDDFMNLFGEQTAQNLNILALGMYGNKVLLEYLDADTWKTFVEVIISMNLSNWNRLNEVLKTEYSVSESFQTEHTKTGTENVTITDTNENLNANKPFNAETFDDAQRQQRTGQKDEERAYNLTDKTIRSNGGGTVADAILKETTIRKKTLQQEILKTIVSEMTLSVYD